MAEAFLIVAVIMFGLAAISDLGLLPHQWAFGWTGVAFVVASFLVGRV